MATITKLSQLDLNGTYSYADYLLWQFKGKLELYDGKVNLMLPSSNTIHQVVLGNIFMKLYAFCKKNNYDIYRFPFENRIFNSNSAILPKDTFTVIKPDFSIYTNPDNCDDLGAYGVPDLIVEVPITNYSDRDYKSKFDLYQKAGVKEYWIIDTVHQVVHVYTLMDKRFYGLQPLVNNDVIFSPQFPDLDFCISDIFMKVDEYIKIIKENELKENIELHNLFKSHKIKNAYLFGSALSKPIEETGDVDILFNYEDNIEPLERGEIWWNLYDKLRFFFNKEVDLVNELSIKNPFLKKETDRTKVLIYG